jgi:hypothetical protein
MATNESTAEKPTASIVRETHLIIGRDAENYIHHYHTPSERVFVVDPTNGLQHVADISGHERDTDWITYIEQEHGWENLDYFTSATNGRWF